MRTSSAGLGLAALAAATFGTSGTFGDSLMAAGWTPGAAVLVRVCLAAVLLTPFALPQLRGRVASLRRAAPSVLGFGLMAVAVCQLAYFNAVAHLSVGVALLLEYSGIILVVLWLWVRHRQRPRALTVGGSVLGIVGLALVLDITGSQRIDPVGVMWGLFAAVGLAAYYLLAAKVHDDLPPLVMAWAGMIVGAITLAFFALVRAIPSTPPPRTSSWPATAPAGSCRWSAWHWSPARWPTA